jgi:hypothetical protein
MFFLLSSALKNSVPLLKVSGDCVCHTEFASTVLSLIDCVWKLKGPRAPGGGGPIVPSLKAGVRLADDGIGDPIKPKRPGNTSVIGDKALGSYVMVEFNARGPPPIPRPSSGSSGIGVGGVGVRGGAGIGRLEAIVAAYQPRGTMREPAEVEESSEKNSHEVVRYFVFVFPRP